MLFLVMLLTGCQPDTQALSANILASPEFKDAVAKTVAETITETAAAVAAGKMAEAHKYYYSEGVMGDLAHAAVLYEQACRSGEQVGCAHLSLILYLSAGMIPKDKARARVLMRAALPELERHCSSSELKACNVMGRAYDEGIGASKDYAKAVSLYKKACDGGAASGCTNLGTMYDYGKGVMKDHSKSLSLHRQACNGGAGLGCSNLGISYANGHGVTKDEAKAASLYKKGCDQGTPGGCTMLGWAHKYGWGVKKDRTMATSLFRKACGAGEVQACKEL